LTSTVTAGSPTSFSWRSPVGSINSANDSETEAKFTNSGYIYLNTTDGTNTFLDSVWIKVNQLPTVKLSDGSFCQDTRVVSLKDDKIIILPSDLSKGNQTWNCLNCKTYSWSKILKNVGTGIQNFVLQIDGANMPLGKKTSDTIVIEFVYQSDLGCDNRDTASIAILRVPKIDFAGFPELCWDEGIVELKEISNVTPINGYWEAYDTMSGTYRTAKDLNDALNNGKRQGDTLDTEATPKPVFPNPYKYYMRYKVDDTECPMFRDTVLIINPLPEPKIVRDRLKIISSSEPYILYDNFNEIALTAVPGGGTWSSSPSGALVGNIFYPKKAQLNVTTTIKYDFVSIKGCRSKDFVKVLVEPLPSSSIITLDTSLNSSQAVAIYPNPTDGPFFIDQSEKFELFIIDVVGKSIEYTKNDTGHYFVKDPGVYHLILINKQDGKRSVSQIVIH